MSDGIINLNTDVIENEQAVQNNGSEGVTNLSGDGTDGNGVTNIDEVGDKSKGNQASGNGSSDDSSTGGAKVELPYEVGSEITIDDAAYTIDENGNAIDSNNQIKFTVDEIKAMLDNNDDSSIIDTLIGNFGEIKDEAGNVMQFEDTPEGVNSLVETIITSKAEEIGNQAILNLFEAYPVLETIVNYIDVNGSLEGFNNKIDRSGITLDADNEAQLLQVCREYYNSIGFDGDIDNLLNYYKDSGVLLTEAQKSLDKLVAADEAEKAKLKAEADAINAQELEAEKQYWNSVKTIVDKGELLGYKIPDKINISKDGKKTVATRNDFFNYLYKPVNADGDSQYNIDEKAKKQEVRLENKILEAYLTFTGSDYSSLVGMAVNKEKVTALKSAKNNTVLKTSRIKSTGNSKDNGSILLT